MKKIIIIFFLLLTSYAYSQYILPPERVRTYDVQHININISFDWDEKKVIGECETSIVPLSDGFTEFEVDAVAFNISSVRDENNEDMEYDYDGEKIVVKLEKSLSPEDTIVYTVNYTCKSQRGLYFIYPTELNPSLPYQIWTQGQRADNKHWIPIYDYPNDKATLDVYITTKRDFETLSNGCLEYSKKIEGTNEKIDHWVLDKPHPSYLIMLAVGEFDIIEDYYEGIPIQSYVHKDKREVAEYSFRNTRDMVRMFSELFDYKYPWCKYGQVVVSDFIYGGMENTTATVLNERSYYTKELEDDYSAEGLISHELAHQWWGDFLTYRSWQEIWLNESFATFGNGLWKLESKGKDEYDYEMLINGDEAIRIDSEIARVPIYGGYGVIRENVYDKGAVILNTFKYILGDKFYPSLNTYLNDNKYGCVVTQDFLDAINKTWNDDPNLDQPPRDFKWMFDQWIWKAGHPELEVKYEYDEEAKGILLNVKQVQKLDSLTPLFRFPVDIRVKSNSEDIIKRLEISREEETFKIKSDMIPLFVQFDYGNNILDKTVFLKNKLDWTHQINYSEDAIDRIMGIRGLEKLLIKNEALLKEWNNIIDIINESLEDKFLGVRCETAKLLGKIKNEKVLKVLYSAYDKQTHPRVKRAILEALGNTGKRESADFILRKIKNENREYIVAEGIEALSKVLPKEEIYDNVISFVNIPSHRHVIQTAVIKALDNADNEISDDRIKKALLDVAFGIDVNSRVRTTAITALIQYAKDEDVKLLAKKYVDYNFRTTKQALIELLGESGDKSLIGFLKELNDNITDGWINYCIKNAIVKLEG
jgi:aminopeptidase N